MDIAQFTFNAFAENTYILSDSGECIVIDSGCSNAEERAILSDYIDAQGLKVVHLVNTHCHIDHVLGNQYVAEKYGVVLTSHAGEQQVLDMQPMVAGMYGLPFDGSPAISNFLDEGDTITVGSATLEVFFTPGHSPASISLYHAPSAVLIAGDVLFQGSIGRTDLPGGSFDVLADSIRTKLYTLPDETRVYPGHGPSTTIGVEKVSNPFVKATGA